MSSAFWGKVMTTRGRSPAAANPPKPPKPPPPPPPPPRPAGPPCPPCPPAAGSVQPPYGDNFSLVAIGVVFCPRPALGAPPPPPPKAKPPRPPPATLSTGLWL